MVVDQHELGTVDELIETIIQGGVPGWTRAQTELGADRSAARSMSSTAMRT